MCAKSVYDLTALVGSRICHDLISPLGAIGNGLELLQMTGQATSPELVLIADSVENANAKVRFFRIAFGNADVGQTLKGSELQTVLKAMYHNTRLNVIWEPDDMPRIEAKLALLTLQCLESALPYGGTIKVYSMAHGLDMAASSDRVVLDEGLWSRLTSTNPQGNLRPAQVQFGLLAELIQKNRRRFNIILSEDQIRVTF